MEKLIIVLMLMLSTAAMAQDYECKYDGSQREMNACAIQDYNEANAELNKVYQVALKKLTVEQQMLLREQQRAWIKRRDARCKIKKTGQGSNTTIDYLTCLQSYTEIRTLQLR